MVLRAEDLRGPLHKGPDWTRITNGTWRLVRAAKYRKRAGGIKLKPKPGPRRRGRSAECRRAQGRGSRTTAVSGHSRFLPCRFFGRVAMNRREALEAGVAGLATPLLAGYHAAHAA